MSTPDTLAVCSGGRSDAARTAWPVHKREALVTRRNVQHSLALAVPVIAAVFAIPAPVPARADPAQMFTPLARIEAVAVIATALATTLDATDSYRLALLRLKGHLGVARSLLQIRADGADYHLQRPLEAIYREIKSQLEERGAPLSADTLGELERATEATPQAALATIDLAASAIDGSFAQTGAVDTGSALALAEALLREAVHLYGESVIDHEVVDVRTYRTGRGFVLQAEALVRHVGGLRAMQGHDELVAAVVLIRQAWPGVDPPPIVFAPESVTGRLEEALAAMDKLR